MKFSVLVNNCLILLLSSAGKITRNEINKPCCCLEMHLDERPRLLSSHETLFGQETNAVHPQKTDLTKTITYTHRMYPSWLTVRPRYAMLEYEWQLHKISRHTKRTTAFTCKNSSVTPHFSIRSGPFHICMLAVCLLNSLAIPGSSIMKIVVTPLCASSFFAMKRKIPTEATNVEVQYFFP